MILVLGSNGFLGKRFCNLLDKKNISYEKISGKSELDIRNQHELKNYFLEKKPTFVVNCCANVGGIQYGYKYPADIFSDNLLMKVNIINTCIDAKVKRLINPIPNCAYPYKLNLFKEENIWDGEMHESVMTYGFVKKGYLIGSWAYKAQHNFEIINLIFSNLYGPEDHFQEERSHALGAILMKIVNAKNTNREAVTIFGTGKPIREWLHVDDASESLLKAISIPYYPKPINIGIGKGISIEDLAKLIKEYVGFKGQLKFDTSKPDGDPFKTMDGSAGKDIMNWSPKIEFKKGLKNTIDWYLNKYY